MEFKVLSDAVYAQFEKMKGHNLYVVDVEGLWEHYLASFPDGSNPMYKERTEHDCQCCKQFIKRAGGVVTAKGTTVWDVQVGGFYQVVVDAMGAYVRDKPIENVFKHDEHGIGKQFNYDPEGKEWNHFRCRLDSVTKKDDIPSLLSETRSNFDVLNRSLDELTLDSAEIVLELIEANSLYRGAEHVKTVELLIKLKNECVYPSDVWEQSVKLKGASKIRNTVIGTLMADISEGKPLDSAVGSFEAKVAPMNYKRPTSLITKSMITKAQKQIVDLGYESALARRYAVAEDITVNNVLFVDRSVKLKDVFSEMASEVAVKPSAHADEMTIEEFMAGNYDSIELMVENRHANNFVSLIAPSDPSSKSMFKWDNNFSWAYEGEMADSIKERVKKAGGSVTGDLRCSLSWFNKDDLDIHVREPDGNVIYFQNKRSYKTNGELDVDMNAGSTYVRDAVENITWPTKRKMLQGNYALMVHQFAQRESSDVGFDAEIEFDGVIKSFSYDKCVSGKITVAHFKFDGENIEIIDSIQQGNSSREQWGINTETFVPVTMIMHSPNHWDGNETGNKHWFFMLEGCNSGSKGRGFFNEFLKEDLHSHRKVFEVLGSKLRAEESSNQLSGLGFSSTQQNHALFRVNGRTIKVVL